MPGLIPSSVFVLTTGSHFTQLRNAAMTASPNTSLRNDSQESTQPTQERPKSEEPYPLSPEAWGSLIPCNIDHPRLSRVDFMKPKLKYTIGRGSRRSGAQCDVTFPKLQELSECPWDCELVEASRPDRSYVDSGRVHCTIEWNGDESATGSQVVITNLDATFGTWVRIGPLSPFRGKHGADAEGTSRSATNISGGIDTSLQRAGTALRLAVRTENTGSTAHLIMTVSTCPC